MTVSTPQPTTAHLKVITPDTAPETEKAIQATDFNAWFGDAHILNNVNAWFPSRGITCIVGPSGSGKSTLIRSINRINDEVAGFLRRGTIHFEGRNIYEDYKDVTKLRTEIGMVFQKPTVFPKPISDNVLFGLRNTKKMSRADKLTLVEENLRAVSLWKEVSHRLDDTATSLSGGQQQRLCIARALAMKPKILLLDEATASVDPVSGRAIEELLQELKKDYTILMVTHDLAQTKRLADHIIFMCDGEMIEQGTRDKMINNPEFDKTATYLSDNFCDC